MNDEHRNAHLIYQAWPTGEERDATRHGPGPQLMGAQTLIGNEVCNENAEDLGVITEIMLDMRLGRISYAVLSFGGFMGIGGKLFAVPWDALKLDTAQRCFVLDVDRQRLARAPGFDKSDWPDMADPTWEKAIHAYYGTLVDGRPPRA